jgi:hypothetical protein
MCKKILFCLFFCWFTLPALAQQEDLEKAKAAIMQEAKELFRLESASWQAGDLLSGKYITKRALVGGYVSYPDGDNTKTLFWTKGNSSQVEVVFTFDSTLNAATASAEVQNRPATATEKELINLRFAAYTRVSTDSFFTPYKGTAYNLVPIIREKERLVYVITASTDPEKVIFGNDYLLHFDAENHLTDKKRLHQDMLPVPVKAEPTPGSKVLGSIHTHTGTDSPFMTATDICTLLLYSRFTNWQSHVVVSEKYVSIWVVPSQSLILLPREQFEKGGK